MNKHQYRAYIKTLQWLVPVRRINFDCETVEVDFGGEGDYAEYNFDEIVLERCTGLVAAKSYRGGTEADRLIFEGDIVRYDGNSHEIVYMRKHAAFALSGLEYGMVLAWEYLSEMEIISTIHDEGSTE